MEPHELRDVLPGPRRLSTLRFRPSPWRYLPGVADLAFSRHDVITRLEVNAMWIYITVAGDQTFLCHRRRMLVDVDVSRRQISIVEEEIEVVYSATLLSRRALVQLEQLL